MSAPQVELPRETQIPCGLLPSREDVIVLRLDGTLVRETAIVIQFGAREGTSECLSPQQARDTANWLLQAADWIDQERARRIGP